MDIPFSQKRLNDLGTFSFVSGKTKLNVNKMMLAYSLTNVDLACHVKAEEKCKHACKDLFIDEKMEIAFARNIADIFHCSFQTLKASLCGLWRLSAARCLRLRASAEERDAAAVAFLKRSTHLPTATVVAMAQQGKQTQSSSKMSSVAAEDEDLVAQILVASETLVSQMDMTEPLSAISGKFSMNQNNHFIRPDLDLDFRPNPYQSLPNPLEAKSRTTVTGGYEWLTAQIPPRSPNRPRHAPCGPRKTKTECRYQ